MFVKLCSLVSKDDDLDGWLPEHAGQEEGLPEADAGGVRQSAICRFGGPGVWLYILGTAHCSAKHGW